MAKIQLLNALQCFEKAGQYLSFKQAAHDLNVTPAAVSHQIKDLEAYLGAELFIRKTRQVALTQLGQQLLPTLREGFSAIHQAVNRAKEQPQDNKLRINTSPSFAGRWLLPRLAEFQLLHPEIDLLMGTSTRQLSLAQEEIDIAIRYGDGHYPEYRVEKLSAEYLIPVCSPEYFSIHKLSNSSQNLNNAKDLLSCNLLHDQGMVDALPNYPGWLQWFSQQAITCVIPLRGLSFESSNFTLQAAQEGHGIALGRSLLVADDLASGKLVIAAAQKIELDYAYYLVMPKIRSEKSSSENFRQWISRL